jgi:tubulin--tyrosine ligase/tubulin polyglutamylase TTLL9
MIDSEKHLWLIEVNTNPCIELSNKWLTAIIPRMLDDALKLTLDRIFYRKKCFKDDI